MLLFTLVLSFKPGLEPNIICATRPRPVSISAALMLNVGLFVLRKKGFRNYYDSSMNINIQ
jgi:hypothetical protein